MSVSAYPGEKTIRPYVVIPRAIPVRCTTKWPLAFAVAVKIETGAPFETPMLALGSVDPETFKVAVPVILFATWTVKGSVGVSAVAVGTTSAPLTMGLVAPQAAITTQAITAPRPPVDVAAYRSHGRVD